MKDTLINLMIAMVVLAIFAVVAYGFALSAKTHRQKIIDEAATVMVTTDTIDLEQRADTFRHLSQVQGALGPSCGGKSWKDVLKQRDELREELRFSPREWEELDRPDRELALMYWHCPNKYSWYRPDELRK